MARLVKVAKADELSPGQGKLVRVDGKDIALFNVGGTYHAMDAACPHEGGPLHEGEVDGGAIVCPWHGYAFSVKTGECSVDPDLRAETYVVRTKGNDVFIEVA
jgi:nitrite reductase/ring-hydroxylating ferredoxin subunit